jgi:hypothetical protein
VLTTNQKGAVSETAVALAAMRLGIPVLKPLVEQPYDLVFEIGGRFVRVQCKTGILRGAVIAVPVYRCRRTRDGLLKRGYSADEIDAVAAYCPDVDRCTTCRSRRGRAPARCSFGCDPRGTTSGRSSTGRATSSSPLHCADRLWP